MARIRTCLCLVALLCLCGPTGLQAQVTLLLEEPYRYDGAFARDRVRGGLLIANLCRVAT
jgi:hypothetical protein